MQSFWLLKTYKPILSPSHNGYPSLCFYSIFSFLSDIMLSIIQVFSWGLSCCRGAVHFHAKVFVSISFYATLFLSFIFFDDVILTTISLFLGGLSCCWSAIHFSHWIISFIGFFSIFSFSLFFLWWRNTYYNTSLFLGTYHAAEVPYIFHTVAFNAIVF